MKVLKSKIFIFILGGIIFSSITAFANNILASEVTYGNSTVKDSIDDLYTKVKPDYTGNTTFTPSSETQMIPTQNKILKNNITINPIPSKYVDISDTTITSSSDIASGKYAYKADGTKVEGTATSTLSEIKVEISADTSTTSAGKSYLELNSNIFKLYKYFEIISSSSSGNVKSCSYNAWSIVKNEMVPISSGNRYEVMSTTDGNNFSVLDVEAVSKSNSWSRCWVTFKFYN